MIERDILVINGKQILREFEYLPNGVVKVRNIPGFELGYHAEEEY